MFTPSLKNTSMYKALGKDDYARHLGVEDQEITSLIIYGGWNPPANHLAWGKQAAYKTDDFFYPLFIDSGVAVTNAYGDAMTSEIVHVFALLGIKKAVLFGTYGALQPGIDFGQLFLPTSVVPEDGASRIYSAEQEFFPNQELYQSAQELWSDTPQHDGKMVSVSAMLGETWEMICEWKEKGYSGVDLETASFLAVANHFKVPAVAMHTLADNLVEEKTIFDVDEKQRRSKHTMKELLFERALLLAKH
jgi:purine-nucleoside phosphorylase